MLTLLNNFFSYLIYLPVLLCGNSVDSDSVGLKHSSSGDVSSSILIVEDIAAKVANVVSSIFNKTSRSDTDISTLATKNK